MLFPLKPYLLAVTLVLASSYLDATAASAAADAGVAPPGDTPLLTTVFQNPRSEQHDVIVLNSGEQLEGAVLNPVLQLHTAHGSLPVEKQYIAGLIFNRAPEHLDAVLTVNRNRISGYINDEIQFKPTSGPARAFSKHEIQQIVFRLDQSERKRAHSHHFVILRNGDLLSGILTLPEIVTRTPSGARPLARDQIESIRFGTAPAEIEVHLNNGTEYPGRLSTNSLALSLDLGTAINVPSAHVQLIYHRPGFIPVEVRHFFASSDTLAVMPHSAPEGESPPGFVWIPPGKFVLGSPSTEPGRGPDEDPQTEITISRGFWMAKHEVTQGEYMAIIGNNPSHFTNDTNRPVEKVSWHEARDYCARLTGQARTAGRLPAGYVFRLPTEAEWEYACRAGTTTRFSYGNDSDETELRGYGWFIENSDSTTHPVGTLRPNPWGLHDMHGNVWEWCLDIWNGSYPGGKLTDYAGPSEGWLRIARGGSWLYAASFSRSANRDDYGPNNRCSDIGFRVVLAPDLNR